MGEGPSKAVMYFGTEAPVETPRLLRAGPLTCELEGGNLRTIRIGGKEALRALSFIVRDENWGTYNPSISNLEVDERPDGFKVSYDAVCKDDRQELRYRATIEGRADGSLVFAGTADAVTDFLTNRTGFVVLHPIEGVAGHWVRVEHTDGKVEESEFPTLIDPMCPFQDIRSLTHEVQDGVRVKLTMEGDAFEMEDHRNWNDASYKTYVRPLAKPWPFTIPAGESTEQRIVLELEGTVGGADAARSDQPLTVQVGEPDGTLPEFGMSLRPDHLEATLDAVDRIQALRPAFLVCPFDSRLADGYDGEPVTGASTFPFDRRIGPRGEVMDAYRRIADETGIALVLEAVLACRDEQGRPSDSVEIMRRDLEKVRRAAADAGVDFAMVAVAPSSDLKCTLPGSVFPPCPPLDAIYAATREAFPDKPVIGGMFSYFTELNRKRPPVDALDAVMHSSCPIVHAADDRTVTENLEALPHIVRSVRAFAPGEPYRPGPAAIGARDNPYGAAATANPDNGRYALAYMDPRQRGLLAAAWYTGYAAHMARAEVSAVTLAAPVGEFGVVYSKTDYPQPWFDQSGGVYPAYHVLKALGAASGKPMVTTHPSDGTRLQSLAWQSRGATSLLIANLTGESADVRIEGLGAGKASTIDETTFVQACDPRDLAGGPLGTGPLRLNPYAVVLVRTG